MKRRLFNLAAALSLLLCAAMVVLWVRSYWVSDMFGFSTRFAIWTDRGSVVVAPSKEYPYSLFDFEVGYQQAPLDDPEDFFNPRRVARRSWDVIAAYAEKFPYVTFVVIELWGPLLLASLLPGIWLLPAMKRRSRLRPNRFSQCGYDLRASTDRCPECGTPVNRKQEASA